MKDSSGRSSPFSGALLWITIAGGVLLAGTVLAVGVARSQNGSAAAGDVSTAHLSQELESVIYLAKLAEGFDFAVRVECTPSQGDQVHFSCGVEATTAGRPAVFWTEFVTCSIPGEARAQRCETGSGYSLQ